MDSLIRVHTQTDKSTVEYVKFMWETMLKLASRPERLSLHIHCIGPSAVERASNLALPGSTTSLVVRASEGGSYGHAACIMDALSMMNDGNTHVICDSDAFLVAKGWDNYIIKKISEGVGIIGTTYEDVGGFSSGAINVQTYKKIPTFTWCAMSSAHPWSTLDVLPRKDHRIHVANAQLSAIYNLPIGYHVFGEAGYQLPQFLFDHKIKYEGWTQLKPSKNATVLSGLSDYHEEFHADGIPFVVHHRGSLRHRYRESRVSRAFFSKVDPWIDAETTKTDAWIGSQMPTSGSQLDLRFMADEKPSPKRNLVLQPSKPIEGWLKITVDGSLSRARAPLSEVGYVVDYPNDNKVRHLRAEGTSNANLTFTLPSYPQHGLTIRNATNVTINVQTASGANKVAVASQTVRFVLVDVDGVFVAA